ncbi:MAG: hypothetical protein WC364_11615 [Eubacteriales bacterium]|jgi:hypothetical protein
MDLNKQRLQIQINKKRFIQAPVILKNTVAPGSFDRRAPRFSAYVQTLFG